MSTLPSTDRRRVTGPEKSRPPQYFEDESEEDDTTPINNLAQPAGGRSDGRKPGDVRPIFLQTGLIPSASGSAYLEASRTKLVVAVHGPRQLKPSSLSSLSSTSTTSSTTTSSSFADTGSLTVSLKFSPFALPLRAPPLRGAESRPLSLRVRAALAPAVRLEKYPKAGIDVYVHVLECDGVHSLVGASVTAAGAALAEAGVEMLGLPIGCAAALCAPSAGAGGQGGEKGGQGVWMDPSEKEARGARGVLGVSCLPALGTVGDVWMEGEAGLEEVDEMVQQCIKMCGEIHHLVVKVLLESAKRRLALQKAE